MLNLILMDLDLDEVAHIKIKDLIIKIHAINPKNIPWSQKIGIG